MGSWEVWGLSLLFSYIRGCFASLDFIPDCVTQQKKYGHFLFKREKKTTTNGLKIQFNALICKEFKNYYVELQGITTIQKFKKIN